MPFIGNASNYEYGYTKWHIAVGCHIVLVVRCSSKRVWKPVFKRYITNLADPVVAVDHVEALCANSLWLCEEGAQKDVSRIWLVTQTSFGTPKRPIRSKWHLYGKDRWEVRHDAFRHSFFWMQLTIHFPCAHQIPSTGLYDFTSSERSYTMVPQCDRIYNFIEGYTIYQHDKRIFATLW